MLGFAAMEAATMTNDPPKTDLPRPHQWEDTTGLGQTGESRTCIVCGVEQEREWSEEDWPKAGPCPGKHP